VIPKVVGEMKEAPQVPQVPQVPQAPQAPQVPQAPQEQQNKQQEQQIKEQAQQALQTSTVKNLIPYGQQRYKRNIFKSYPLFAMSWERIVAKVIIVLLVIVLVTAAVVAIHYSPCNLLKVIGREKMYGKPQDYHAGCTPHYAFRGSHDYNLVNYKPPNLINMYPSRHNFIHDI